MPKKIKRDYSYEDYLEIKKENKRKLDEIFAMENYQEVLGRKYYGDNWLATLWGNHPAKAERHKENTQKALRRMKGERVPYKKTQKESACIQFDLEGNKIKEWESVNQAIEELGWKKSASSQILRCCKGEHLTAYNFKWQLKEDE